jgi:hypothetical protein
MAFDPDELLMYKGTMIAKGVIWHKVKSLGWSAQLFATLDENEVIKVLEERKTPKQMGKSLEATFVPNQQPSPAVLLQTEEGSDPSVMAPAGSQPVEDLAPLPGSPGAVLESGVAVAAIAPPAHAGKHLRPIDPTRPQPGQPAPVPAPQPPMGGATGYAPPPKAINVKPPKTDTGKLMSMLDAAFQLAGNDATVNTAKVLISTNGLERAFQAMYPDLAKKVLGRLDMTPDSKCRGGTVLDIEIEADNGYCHIITSAGVITLTGNNLVHKGSEP